jgi:hypothetical protein
VTKLNEILRKSFQQKTDNIEKCIDCFFRPIAINHSHLANKGCACGGFQWLKKVDQLDKLFLLSNSEM